MAADKLQPVQVEVAAQLAALDDATLGAGKRQRLDGAVGKYIASRQDKAWDAQSQAELGWMLALTGSADDSAAAFAAARGLDAKLPALYLREAEAAEALGHTERIEGILQEGLQQLPGNTALLTALGNEYMRQGNQDGALGQFRSANASDPTDPDAAFACAGLLAMEGEHQAASAVLATALAAQPWNQALLLAQLGELGALGDPGASELQARIQAVYPWLLAPAG